MITVRYFIDGEDYYSSLSLGMLSAVGGDIIQLTIDSA